MAKNPKAGRASQAAVTEDTQDFRRWCIERAMEWPQQYAGLPGQYPGGAVIESDVIGKAAKIRRWVLEPDSAGEK